jgi:lipid-A-disaccharide synthase
MDRFGAAVELTVARHGPVELVLPAVPHHAEEIRARAASWVVQPTIVEGEVATYAAFRRAHAALAASGTVTLELALSGVPMVVAYRVDPVLRALKSFLQAHSIVLPNLILGDNTIPEYLDADTNPHTLSDALIPLLSDTPQRRAQLAGFDRLEELMKLPEGGTPSATAAGIVLAAMAKAGELAPA